MELLVIRHAEALDPEAFAATGKPDAARPLTKDGRRKMGEGARALPELVPTLDILASSPLKRAVQTAQIVAKAYGGAAVVEITELEPDQHPDLVVSWLKRHAGERTVAVVGHEPSLSRLVTYLIAGSVRTDPLIELKKGAACLVGFPGAVAAGAGVLRWSVTPKQLRAVGD